ncbi:TlpA family protein disulfide reductase [Rubeoparvulum massiliense]|uniref:TlpA family protein disulfide reductase n=1 Tax=Rubeoparvulum massiliense TaxID=1631346 RepID=UPI00065E3A1B|nr:TlpA disulfide reductase family protein [Rubeoparvulum massiliense]
MKRSLYLIILSLLFFTVLLNPYAVMAKKEKDFPLRIGDPLPSITLTDLEGKEHELRQSHSTPFILNFWASWCPPCRDEMPVMQQFYTEKKELLPIIGINLFETEKGEKEVQKFLEQFGVTFPILLDPNSQVAKQFNVFAIPSTYLINEKGMIIDQWIGPLTSEVLQEWMQHPSLHK